LGGNPNPVLRRVGCGCSEQGFPRDQGWLEQGRPQSSPRGGRRLTRLSGREGVRRPGGQAAAGLRGRGRGGGRRLC
jgi:hypothetical protein